MKKYILLSILTALITGCASDYPCGEPRTGRCSSIAENYQRSNQPIVNPEDQPINPYENCSSGNCSGSSSSSSSSSWFSSNDKVIKSAKYPQVPSNASPLVSTPNMMRVWITPYVDADNIYHDQGYQYMLVDRGHWLFGTNNVFGRGKSFKELTTTLTQDTNATQVEEAGSSSSNKQSGTNTTNTTSGINNNPNTPALNYLKQQDQTTVSSMGLGK